MQPPKDDKELINFVKEYHPQVPNASPELEAKILQQISQEKRENVVNLKPLNRRLFYLFPSSLAAGLVIFIATSRLMPHQPTDAELSKIESFMENNWHGTVSGYPEEDVSSITN
jgi:hypothetical protein